MWIIIQQSKKHNINEYSNTHNDPLKDLKVPFKIHCDTCYKTMRNNVTKQDNNINYFNYEYHVQNNMIVMHTTQKNIITQVSTTLIFCKTKSNSVFTLHF
uniref:Uncharacterized protein n=1 Tax=Zea mays TaxID=4577 RepID=A0A804Q664_MAIZE